MEFQIFKKVLENFIKVIVEKLFLKLNFNNILLRNIL